MTVTNEVADAPDRVGVTLNVTSRLMLPVAECRGDNVRELDPESDGDADTETVLVMARDFVSVLHDDGDCEVDSER